MVFEDFKEQQAFERWAFGKAPVMYFMPLLFTWNSRHGDLYWASRDHDIEDSVKTMYAYYKAATAGSQSGD